MFLEENRRHEIFEEGACPRDKCGTLWEGENGSVELVPTAEGEGAFGEREEIGDARFGCECLIETIFESLGRHMEADRNE